MDMYVNGFQGAPIDMAHREEFIASLPMGYYGDFMHGIDGSGKGKIALPYKIVQKYEPEFGAYEAQETGDCTSHGLRNACMVSMCCDIDMRKQPEMYKGRLATEVIYGYRGFAGQGMNASRAAQFVANVSGIHTRTKYGQYDLSRYNWKLGDSWGRSGPPKELVEAGKLNPVETVTALRKTDEVRDLIYNGYGVTIACNYGFANKRDQNGMVGRSGSWNHQMSVVGCDDSRTKVQDIIFLIQNSWGPNWIGGPKIYDQPDGSFWIRGEILQGMISSGECWGISGVKGFPTRELNWSIYDDLF